MAAQLRRHRDLYLSGPLAPYVRAERIVGDNAAMMECRQPRGDMSDPPSLDLVIVETLNTGWSQNSDFGAGRFRETAPVGALYLIPPGVATDIHVDGPHSIRCLAISSEFVRRSLPYESHVSIDFGHLHRNHFINPAARHLSSGLWHAAVTQNNHGSLHADSVLSLIVAELALLAGAPRPSLKGGLAPWQIRRVTEAMAQSDDAALSLAQLAEMAGLSIFHFSRAFRRSMGMAPHRYQMTLRIDRARAMLEDTRCSVTEIAMAVGYDSSQALARAFRQHTGISPTEYRRERWA